MIPDTPHHTFQGLFALDCVEVLLSAASALQRAGDRHREKRDFRRLRGPMHNFHGQGGLKRAGASDVLQTSPRPRNATMLRGDVRTTAGRWHASVPLR